MQVNAAIGSHYHTVNSFNYIKSVTYRGENDNEEGDAYFVFYHFPATSEGVFQEAATTDSQQHTAAPTRVQQENRRGKKDSFQYQKVILVSGYFRIFPGVCNDLQSTVANNGKIFNFVRWRKETGLSEPGRPCLPACF